MTRCNALIVAFALLGLAGPAGAQPLGTAFTYQGQLTESGQPAVGLYDLQVCLYDSPASSVALSCVPDLDDVPVQSGVFTIALDFGSAAFIGQQRFIELRVRPGSGSGTYTTLAPRQLVRAVPEALRAGVASAAPWSGLTGVPPGFADGIDNNSGGTVTAITAGAGLGGGTITGSGTIGIANGGIVTAMIAPRAVGTAQLANDAVDTTRIADGSIVAADLGAGSVGAAQLATSAVGTAAIQDLAITRAKIALGVVDSSRLALGAVGLAQINAGQVQARISGTCPIGDYFRGINADGSVVCEPVPGVPRIVVIDEPGTNLGEWSAIAIGADGLPVISFSDTTAGNLRVAKCSNAACTGPVAIHTVDDPANTVGSHNAIAVDNDGLPIISYRDSTANALKVAKCVDPACAEPAIITTVDNPVNSVGQYTDIAVGPALPVISYYDSTAGALKVAACTNLACSGAAIINTLDDPANDVGITTSVAIGIDVRPVISYHDSTGQTLKVAKCANINCVGLVFVTTVDNPANSVGLFTSIAIGADGRPVVSYYDSTANTLKVAQCANFNCTGVATITTVDESPTNVGTNTAIAIGVDGLPVISYSYGTASSVRVAQCTTAACTGTATITTVDDPAGLVAARAIAIGADGLPVLAYYDSTRDALKVAKCGSRSCQ
jgi:hypothetical protein